MVNSKFDDEGVPTDGIASFQTRLSMQSRRSSSSAYLNGHGDREGLIHSYDVENNQTIGLSELTEESDGEPGPAFARNETALHTKQNTQV